MTRFGYFLSSEEHDPSEIVRQARLAEEAGFESLWISDHTVDTARLYSVPDVPPPVYMSGFGEKAIKLALTPACTWPACARSGQVLPRLREEAA